MIAGTLPAPTPSAGFPLEYADLTIPGPPVARIISAVDISRFVSSKLGTSIQAIISSGAPASTAASKISLAAAIVLFFALGCGLIIIPFLVFKASKHLKIAVEVGLVVGITAATTPMGQAIFSIPFASSLSITPQVFVSLYLL